MNTKDQEYIDDAKSMMRRLYETHVPTDIILEAQCPKHVDIFLHQHLTPITSRIDDAAVSQCIINGTDVHNNNFPSEYLKHCRTLCTNVVNNVTAIPLEYATTYTPGRSSGTYKGYIKQIPETWNVTKFPDVMTVLMRPNPNKADPIDSENADVYSTSYRDATASYPMHMNARAKRKGTGTASGVQSIPAGNAGYQEGPGGAVATGLVAATGLAYGAKKLYDWLKKKPEGESRGKVKKIATRKRKQISKKQSSKQRKPKNK